MRNRQIASILTAAQSIPWAILPAKLEEIRAILFAHAMTDATADDIKRDLQGKIVGPNDVPRAQQFGSIAVVPVFGTIGHRMNMFSDFSGGTSTEQLKAQIQKAVSDESISALVLDVNSPGGTVGGLPEVHEVIMSARAVKPVVASVNAMSASAAYWITSAASEICITPSGEAGSIGVFYLHEDVSGMLEQMGVKVSIIKAGKFKAEGNEWQPLTEEAIAEMQGKVDHYYGMFVSNVAAGRGVSVADVRSKFGEGRMLTATQAKSVGMVDRIETMDATLNRLSKKGGVGRVKSAGASALQMGMDLARSRAR